MEPLQYKIIKNKAQYNQYCNELETLLQSNTKLKGARERIELLTLLIEKWDEEHTAFADLNPVELLEALMEEHSLRAVDLVKILGVSKGLVSDILSYKKGFSKEVIRKLAEHFKMSQEAFNRPYTIKAPKSFAVTKAQNSRQHIRKESAKAA